MIDGGEITKLDEPIGFQKEKHHAETASKIAFSLIWIMAGSFLIHYVLLSVALYLGQKEIADGASSVFGEWLPVISGFVGGAVTYYFTKEKK